MSSDLFIPIATSESKCHKGIIWYSTITQKNQIPFSKVIAIGKQLVRLSISMNCIMRTNYVAISENKQTSKRMLTVDANPSKNALLCFETLYLDSCK